MTRSFISKKNERMKNQKDGVMKKLKNRLLTIAKYRWKKKMKESQIVIMANEIMEIL